MASRRAKINLEMGNGIKVRTIAELKENFDVKIVVGYFLDGKLKKWLEDRWYEEEAAAVDQLDENDSLLTKKLCEIFGVEYKEEEINPEAIAARNARIAKLKQYTDDESIIKRVDDVAFNQGELEDLYDRDIETIYLCEGEFIIPKSKQSLEYEIIGMAQIEELKECATNDVVDDLSYKQKNVIKSQISAELADYIGYKAYAELEDYVVWMDYNGSSGPSTYEYDTIIKPFFKTKNLLRMNELDRFKIWNKKTDEYSSISSIGSSVSSFCCCGNKLIWREYKGICEYDVILNKYQYICKDSTYCLYHELSVCDNKVAFWDENLNLVVYDITSRKKVFSKKFENKYGSLPMYFCLIENKLFYQEKDGVIQYDLDKNTEKIVFRYTPPETYKNSQWEFMIEYGLAESVIYANKIAQYENALYIMYSDCFERTVKVIKVKTGHEYEYVMGDSIPFEGHIWFFEETTSVEKNPYLVFYKERKIYILNMKTDEIKSYSGDFPSSMDQIHVVGNYLYWGGKYGPTYRVNLDGEWEPIIIQK